MHFIMCAFSSTAAWSSYFCCVLQTKKESDPSVVLGIFHQGLRIHHVTKDGTHLLDFEFPWAKVGRLYFAVNIFSVVGVCCLQPS